jgi:hypothetical protein
MHLINLIRNTTPTKLFDTLHFTLWKLSYAPRVRPPSSRKVEYANALDYIGPLLDNFYRP